ncbi:SIR2 family protein [Pelagibius marinus]|uniref:SIR2 family protein n=1 Tax=Pelagibius marinus TaxID=2762760 RepID=UPI001872F8E4|nr:SIR2 family protein [Pelagibius marinus]
MSVDVREQVLQWLTGAETCFLIGAGCSACANKPLIGALTTQVMEEADSELQLQFSNLKQTNGRPATIEDLITYLQRYRNILSTITNGDVHSVSIDQIDKWLAAIKEKIVNEIVDDWQPNSYHRRFLRRIRNHRESTPRDIFSLNYDTVLEANLDELRIPYIDGFRGTNRAWFDSATFDESRSGDVGFRIYKLHGSINWTRDDAQNVRRSFHRDSVNEPIVVYPSEQKYLQTQFGVYETLMGRFRDRMRMQSANNCLVVLGYSFNDEHINEAITDAVNTRNTNLTVIAFVGPDADRDMQDARLKHLAEQCQSRFNAFVGDNEEGTFIGQAVDSEDSEKILSAALWRFENLVDFIAGEDG